MAKSKFKLNINGKVRRVTADPDEPLLWALRDRLGLTGTKFGCGEGACGACTVLMDGEAVRSCIISVSDAAKSKKIVTVEGLAKGSKLTKLQKAFLKKTAFQCGFCTPGMLISATALLKKDKSPTREEIIEAMNNNLCRCGSYPNIIDAVLSVSKNK